MLWITRPGLSTSVCGIIGSCSGSVYSWMPRSLWIIRPGSDKKVHAAPTDARNSWRVWWSSVAIVTIWVRHSDRGIERGEFEMLLVLLWAMTARKREDQRIVALKLAEALQNHPRDSAAHSREKHPPVQCQNASLDSSDKRTWFRHAAVCRGTASTSLKRPVSMSKTKPRTTMLFAIQGCDLTL
jgi:hypothetical protein